MKNIPPEESVVVLLLSSTGLQVLHNDKRALLPNFRHDEMLGEGETSGEQIQADRVKHDRILLSLRAMEVIAEHMAGVAGRKNLIWITAGIPRQINLYESPRSIRDRASYTAEYKQAISAINGASVAVYTVDARGLDAMGGSRPVYGPQNRWERPANMDAINSDQQNREGLKDLAYATGGRVYFDRNDLDRSIAEALADARTSYTLGYYQPRDADGTWRRIQVRVKRKDVKVRHRLGYLAIDRTGGARDASLKRVLASPLDSTAIGMTGALQVETHGAWRALLQIDPSHVSLTPAGSGYRCRLEIVTLVRNSAGQAVGKAEIDTVDRLLEGQALRSAMENGVLFRKDLRVPQNAHDVRFAVRDPVTGLLGTLSIPLAKK
jgi:VWFA-related protein